MSQEKKSTSISVEPINPSLNKNLNYPVPGQPVSRQNQAQNQTPRQKNDLQSNYQTPRQTPGNGSPTRFGEGTRIAKRELWWKEPPPSKFKIQLNHLNKPQVGPRIDDRNIGYQTPKSQKSIENMKLEWKAQPAVDTWGNIKHRPQGGNKRYPSEQVVWQAQPAVDTWGNFKHLPQGGNKRYPSEQVVWQAQPAVDTWGNFKHLPQGGNKRYPSEQVVWQAQPKVDSGFIYYFEEQQ